MKAYLFISAGYLKIFSGSFSISVHGHGILLLLLFQYWKLPDEAHSDSLRYSYVQVYYQGHFLLPTLKPPIV